jgi:hypothetical protein
MAEETTEKKPPFCTTEGEESVLSFNFANGEKVSVDLNDLNEDISSQLLVHGLTQKCRDSFAGAKGDFAVAVAAVTKVIENLKEGQWNASRASGGDAKPRITELAEAIANIKKLPIETVQKAVEAAEDDQRKAWRKNGAVAAEILRIRAAKAQARAEKAAEAGTDEELAGF